MYDPLQDQWTQVASLHQARGKHGLVSSQDQIYAVGGVSGFRQSDQLDTIERYDRTTNTWQMMSGKLSVVRGPVSVTLVH